MPSGWSFFFFFAHAFLYLRAFLVDYAPSSSSERNRKCLIGF